MQLSALLCVFLAVATAVQAQQATLTVTGIPSVEYVCDLPADPGPCEAYIPSWYFDSTAGECRQFVYGGCDGNGNRFGTKSDCEAACRPVNKCLLGPDPGPCKALFPRWYYDATTGRCEKFTYGGCQGNANNFETLGDCQRACRKDCNFVNCFVDPCSVSSCPAFPEAQCVANYCNGCEADYYVGNKRVDCSVTPNCHPEGRSCMARRQNAAIKCCEGLQCCACGPPVEIYPSTPPRIGTCQKLCACPRG